MKKLLALLFLPLSVQADFFVIEMKREVSKVEIQQIASMRDIKAVNRLSQIANDDLIEDGYLKRLYEVEGKSRVYDALKALDFVKLVEKDSSFELMEIKENDQTNMIVNDLLYPKQWGLINDGQIVSEQRVNGGSEKTLGQNGVDINWGAHIDQIENMLIKTPIVAVVDMGIDLEHEDLAHAIYKNDIECDGGALQAMPDNGVRQDRDRNGFPGDCMGWNFAASEPLYEASAQDDKGHGTHVSGIIAAKRNNQKGIAGVSDKIKILPLRVVGRVDEDLDERNKLRYIAPSRRIAKAIYYALYRGVDVINLSLAWPKSMDTLFLRRAFDEARKRNVLVVAAAGNNNTQANVYPCAYNSVVCVGSVNNDGKVSLFSNHGGEVDLLAPGNQIVSTIPEAFAPLKLNVQGYDIMSGTSQSAPYVSAIGALLKSIVMYKKDDGKLYQVPNDEIKRRLFDSASEVKEPEKSLHGIVNLDAALRLGDAPSIKPVFKGITELVFNGQTGTLQIPLILKNYGKEKSSIKVKVISHNSAVDIDGAEIEVDLLRRQESKRLNFNASILDLNGHSKLEYKVVINGKSYLHQVQLSRRLDLTQGNVIPVKFLDKKLPLITFRKEYQDSKVWSEMDIPQELRKLWKKINGKERATKLTLQTMEMLRKSNQDSDYYLVFQDRENEKKHTVSIFHHLGDSVVELPKKLVFEDTIQVLTISMMDYNYDGKLDYEIKTIKHAPLPGVYSRVEIVRHYFNRDLTPLFAGSSTLSYFQTNDSIKVTVQTQKFTRGQLPSGEKIALPVFVTAGKLSEEDQIFDPFQSKDNSYIRRIYYLQPTLEDKSLVLKPRTFMNLNFVSEVRENFKSLIGPGISEKDTGIELVSLLTQSPEEFKYGIVKGIVSYGLGFERYNIEVSIKGDQYRLRHLKNVEMRLVGNAHHIHSNLDQVKDENAFVGFETNSGVNITNVDQGQERADFYRLNTPYDRLVSFIHSYTFEGNKYSLFETIDDILLVVHNRDQVLESRLNIAKYSYLPGVHMSALFYPLTTQYLNKTTPGIYVDPTTISGNRIYTMTIKDEKLIAPLNLSQNLPQVCGVQDGGCGLNSQSDTKYCLPMTPKKSQDGRSYYMILCKDKEEYFIKKIAI